ncbi:LysR family transcriptional regulator [Streptomyces griseoviridis]|uniref:LysR family transcriptional regulator n=3 Tax=Streptomyces TaxID=1883 RepID=A0A918GJ29_STRGD|nr:MULTISPECIES: LysR family transcriptional regulator [Streptomyces]MDP9679631.1 DNA-binding transcriptional LysR family regulator [Streptomyces griseoviridis]GGS39841.1 LysR family transcriptional regulator [Streptomyces niveoruber]GGS99775.1 LysR family transcriptional regulator [Streptomyces griseoviridis]GGU23904.1 LysR family transcriptional regulator [Streptomyces daghestanicus]GHI29902.1 LysR family transcriptional regulator [Streptomyces daghestanicus]
MTSPLGFTLVQLRYFLVAAERGSMTEASQELHIAQSAVSTAVYHLERDLQVQLFIRRRGRGLTLTPAGERLRQQARDLLARAREVEREARGDGGNLTGPVTVGCFVTLAPYYLPPLFSECTRRHPGIQIDVVEGETDDLVRALTAGHLDFALTYGLGLSAEPELRAETIALAPAYVIVPAGHPLAGRDSVDLAELSAEPLVLLDLPHSRDYFHSLVAATGTAPDVRYRTRSYETVRSLVARGLGYSVLNQRPVTSQTYGGGEVAELRLRDGGPPLEVKIAAVDGMTQTARARAVMDLLREIAGP